MARSVEPLKGIRRAMHACRACVRERRREGAAAQGVGLLALCSFSGGEWYFSEPRAAMMSGRLPGWHDRLPPAPAGQHVRPTAGPWPRTSPGCRLGSARYSLRHADRPSLLLLQRVTWSTAMRIENLQAISFCMEFDFACRSHVFTTSLRHRLWDRSRSGTRRPSPRHGPRNAG